MAQFIIKMEAVKTNLEEETRIIGKLEEMGQSILCVADNLGFEGASKTSIRKNLVVLSESVEQHKRGMGSMRDSLYGTVNLYEKTEKGICDYANGISSGAALAGAGVSTSGTGNQNQSKEEANVNGDNNETGNIIARTEIDSVQLIRNCTAQNDPGFIEGGCVITSMANLYRRKLACENRSDDVDRNTIRSANNGEVNMSWDIVSNRMEENFGYGMTYEYKQPRDLNGINQLLSEHPEGIMVYSSGKTYYHAMLIVGQENGRYKVVDPIDGGIKYWEDCYSVSSPNGTFHGWTIDNFLQNTNRLAYISG